MRKAILAILTILALSFRPVRGPAQIAPGVLQPAAKISTVTGTVLTVKSTPVSGAVVQLGGPSLVKATTDDQGRFILSNVPNGRYLVTVTAAGLGAVEQRDLQVNGDLSIEIQYEPGTSAALKTIARVTTQQRGNTINTTAASIASVSPGQYALDGHVSWRGLLEGVPGVAVSGGLAGGNDTSVVIPDSPFQPIILSINGAYPYETSTTLDGMPLSNYSLATTPGTGVDLSELPMSLFDTADVVRGPGANAPSIAGSIGGSFVLHPPGSVDKTSLQTSYTSDPYGGLFSTTKATIRAGKLFSTIGYSFNNSPGPYGVSSFVGMPTYPGAGVSINGTPVKSTQQLTSPNPIYGQCYCEYQTTLVGAGGLRDTSWDAHNGGVSLGYDVSRAVTAEFFYAGAQATASQPQPLYNEIFAPSSTYNGAQPTGTHPGSVLFLGTNPQLQSASLLEEKVTSYVGKGVLRFAALQNYTYDTLDRNAPGPTKVQLFGTGDYCNNAQCSSTTPFTFHGESGTMTFTPFTYFQNQRSTNNDLLASYETELGSRGYAGASWVKSANSATNSIYLSLLYNGAPVTQSSTVPLITQSITEYRVHGGFHAGDDFGIDASYYFSNADYHVPNPAVSTEGSWVDSRFSYSAPRFGFTWQPSHNVVARAALGGGYALPPLFFLVGSNGQETCSLTACYVQQTNLGLRPETSFAWDVGSDARLARGTIASLDFYRSDLYGQLYQSQNVVGVDPTVHLPLYVQEYLNLSHSRFEGINLSVKSDRNRRIYYSAGLGLTRGYVLTVPPGFYNENGGTCNYHTGANCTNTYVIPGPNFNGTPGTSTVSYQSAVPYANGSAVLGYRWVSNAFVEVKATYFGNNNAYLQPAFMEFDARAGYRLQEHVTIIAAFQNFTGIHDQSYQLLQVNPAVLAPTVTGFPLPLYPIPYGPRALLVTANLDL